MRNVRKVRSMIAGALVLVLAGLIGPAGTPVGASRPAGPGGEAPQHVGFTPTEGLHEGAWVVPEPGVWEPTPGGEGPGLLAICRSVDTIDPVRDCQVGLGRDRVGIPVWSEFEEVSTHWYGGWSSTDTESVRVARVIALPDGLHDCRTDGCALTIEHGGVMTVPVPVEFGPEWAPWPSAEAFVDSVLVPLPLRPVSTVERDSLVAEVAAGTTPNRDIVLRLAREPQVDATVGEVVRQYGAAFGRRPETGGLAYWEARARAGMSPEHMARAFAGTPEARETYEHLQPGQIVDRLYATAFGRTPESAGRAYWVDRLEAGLPLWTLVWHVARSPEMRARWSERSLATALSWAWHREAPDPTRWVMGGTRYARFALAGDWPGSAPGRVDG